PIYPLLIILFKTERFSQESLKHRDFEHAQHFKLEQTGKIFRKWARKNISHLRETARNLEYESEVHDPRY
ncbi:hypothetical protein B0T20DRAFT_353617, partial [Sordaria brevicollis]